MYSRQSKLHTFAARGKFCNKVASRALELGLNIVENLGVMREVYMDHAIICPLCIATEDELRDVRNVVAGIIGDAAVGFGDWIVRASKTLSETEGRLN